MGTLEDAQNIVKAMLKDEVDLLLLVQAVHHLGYLEGIMTERSINGLTKQTEKKRFWGG